MYCDSCLQLGEVHKGTPAVVVIRTIADLVLVPDSMVH